MNNEKQIGMAMMLYGNDYSDYVVPGDANWPDSDWTDSDDRAHCWAGILSGGSFPAGVNTGTQYTNPLTGNGYGLIFQVNSGRGNFVCPAESDPFNDVNYTYNDGTYAFGHYAINPNLASCPRWDSDYAKPHRFGQMSLPSEVVMVVEAANASNAHIRYEVHNAGLLGTQRHSGKTGTTDGTAAGTVEESAMCNVLWGDGHVTYARVGDWINREPQTGSPAPAANKTWGNIGFYFGFAPYN
ncbi:MAG: hypothetical protein IKO65_11485 [Victivallales bacterium]|nr:hypothetical protein [Victivallales bacterium]